MSANERNGEAVQDGLQEARGICADVDSFGIEVLEAAKRAVSDDPGISLDWSTRKLGDVARRRLVVWCMMGMESMTSYRAADLLGVGRSTVAMTTWDLKPWPGPARGTVARLRARFRDARAGRESAAAVLDEEELVRALGQIRKGEA